MHAALVKPVKVQRFLNIAQTALLDFKHFIAQLKGLAQLFVVGCDLDDKPAAGYQDRRRLYDILIPEICHKNLI